MLTELTELDELDRLLRVAAAAWFTAPTRGACEALRPKLHALFPSRCSSIVRARVTLPRPCAASFAAGNGR